MKFRIMALLGFFAAVAVSQTTNAAEVQLLGGGKVIKGTVESIDAQFLTIKEEGAKEPLKISVKELALVELGAKPLDLKGAAFDEIELTDGSILRSVPEKLTAKAKNAIVAVLPGPKDVPSPTVEPPLSNIRYFLRNGHDSANQNTWKAQLANRDKRDIAVINVNGAIQRLKGTVLEGTVKGVALSFEQEDGEKVELALARINVGLIFNQPPRAVIPPTLCRVIDAFGNTLVATKIEFSAKAINVTTVSGAVFVYPALSGLARLDFSQSNVTYLSTVTPAVDAPDDLTELGLTYTVDKTRTGKPLQLDGKTYAKGMCVFGGVTLTYQLGGDYNQLKTVLGVDESVEVANSKVKVTIFADDRKLLDGVVISRKDKPRDLTLDVKDAKQLKIIVERDELFQANSVNFADIRVQK